MSEPTPSPARWTLPRLASVIGISGTLFTILGAGGGAAMSTGKLENRVSVLEKQAVRTDQDRDRLIRIEAAVEAIKSQLEKEQRR